MYRNLPVGSTASYAGPVPPANGDPGTALRLPVVGLMANPETPTLAVYQKRPRGSIATPKGWKPAAKGEPDTGLIDPVARFR